MPRQRPAPKFPRFKSLSEIIGVVQHLDPTQCWNWPYHKRKDGYGKVSLGKKDHYTHRLFYETLKTPLAKGEVIDHLCRNTSCCNPRHLEPVSQKENCLRGISPAAANAAKTECFRGHPLSGTNLYTSVDKQGRVHRQCQVCARLREGRRKRGQKCQGL